MRAIAGEEYGSPELWELWDEIADRQAASQCEYN